MISVLIFKRGVIVMKLLHVAYSLHHLAIVALLDQCTGILE